MPDENIGFIVSLGIRMHSYDLNPATLTLYNLYAVRWRVDSIKEDIQYGGGMQSRTVKGIQYRCATTLVRRSHIVSTVEGVQCGPVTPSVRMYQIFSTVEDVQ